MVAGGISLEREKGIILYRFPKMNMEINKVGKLDVTQLEKSTVTENQNTIGLQKVQYFNYYYTLLKYYCTVTIW